MFVGSGASLKAISYPLKVCLALVSLPFQFLTPLRLQALS